ncbi:MAG TPA: hypothetical protein VKR59_10480 [Terriglobales bacterium]|nr:hypothetical protein [Terriglobales bacterium]
MTRSQTFADLAAHGFEPDELAAIPGVRVIDQPFITPSPDTSVYAFSKETVHRNLYRVPLP